MRTHKSDENMSDCEFHDHHKSIFVAPDDKDLIPSAKLHNYFEFQKKTNNLIMIPF